jgi:hypothetical protein
MAWEETTAADLTLGHQLSAVLGSRPESDAKGAAVARALTEAIVAQPSPSCEVEVLIGSDVLRSNSSPKGSGFGATSRCESRLFQQIFRPRNLLMALAFAAALLVVATADSQPSQVVSSTSRSSLAIVDRSPPPFAAPFHNNADGGEAALTYTLLPSPTPSLGSAVTGLLDTVDDASNSLKEANVSCELNTSATLDHQLSRFVLDETCLAHSHTPRGACMIDVANVWMAQIIRDLRFDRQLGLITSSSVYVRHHDPTIASSPRGCV